MKPPSRRAAALGAALSLALPAEGLRRLAYIDPGGVLTVCYGSTRDVETGREYSFGECRDRLEGDMLHAIDIVERCAPDLPVLTLAAFADAVYNLGPVIVCDVHRSRAARLLRAGDIRGACEELPRWNKVRIGDRYYELPGLSKRRQLERDACLKGLESES